MGKLKFTLSNIWFWVALVAICFLTENLSLLTTNFKEGFNFATLAVLSVGCLLCLFLYYFINHKENKVKMDIILLPAICIVGMTLLFGIWLQDTAIIPFANGSDSITVTFSIYEKIRASIIVVLFLGVAYAFMFMMNANRPSHRIIMLMAFVGIGAALVSVIFSLATEMNVYVAIFKGDDVHGLSIDSFYGNKNYYGGILFIGIMTCFIVNYYRPRLHWYILIAAFYVILVSTVAVLPTLICTIAVPLYLLEEIFRFGLKRKWKYSVFALISLLIIMSLAILYFWGSNYSWKGFIGLDAYISDTFKHKDFLTYSGRTKIWQTIVPYCFDSPIHAVFGHGFMLSEKLIKGITGAMNNSIESGVKTTHNGYLEILFDYGILGLLTHVVLISYFVYCAIRLLLEKRFHFVFVYSFVVLCCAAFNFCESSSFFDIGVKEIYMTVLFMMPVIAEYKISHRKEKLEEIRNLPVEKKTWEPIKVGKWLSVIIVSFLVVGLASLAITTIYEIKFVKYLVLNIVIGLAIALVFIPYLVTLFFKGDKMHFILHCTFNGLLIVSSTFILYMFLRAEGSTKAMIPYLIPGLLVVALTIETVVYSLIKNGSLKEWAKILASAFVIGRNAIVGGIVLTLVPGLLLQLTGNMNLYIYIVCVIIGLIGYYGTFHFFPTKGGKELLDDANELAVWNIKRIALKDEIYYG